MPAASKIKNFINVKIVAICDIVRIAIDFNIRKIYIIYNKLKLIIKGG